MSTPVQDAYWLGGYQDRDSPAFDEPNGAWRWVTDEPWRYTHWNRGLYQEPHNAPPGPEDCLAWVTTGGWNDAREDEPRPGYLVEYEPVNGVWPEHAVRVLVAPVLRVRF